MTGRKLDLYLYKDEEADIGLLIWATCINDATDRVCFYLFTVKGVDASYLTHKDTRRKINKLREPAKGCVFEEFKINVKL